MLATLLDEHLPYIAGCEIRDNPFAPICRRCRDLVREKGDDTPIAWLDARRALRGEAGDAGRDHRRHDRRHRSHQGRAQRARIFRTS